MWYHGLSSKGLGQPAPVALLFGAHMASLLNWLHSLIAAFLGMCSMFPNILRSPFQLRLYLQSSTHNSQNLPARNLTLPQVLSLISLPLKSQWKPPRLHKSYIHHVDYTKVCHQFEQYLGPLGPQLQWLLSA